MFKRSNRPLSIHYRSVPPINSDLSPHSSITPMHLDLVQRSNHRPRRDVVLRGDRQWSQRCHWLTAPSSTLENVRNFRTIMPLVQVSLVMLRYALGAS